MDEREPHAQHVRAVELPETKEDLPSYRFHCRAQALASEDCRVVPTAPVEDNSCSYSSVQEL